ncbi:kinase-like domain-containing protein [Entophlyctis helioformis]|nr:kinase-like domain-containing protein [Entophlyctis helioformis]
MAATHVESNQSVAIKVLRREEVIRSQMTDHVKNEARLIDVMKRLGHHENIVGMVDLMATPTKIYIVMDLIVGGEVLYHLASQGSFSEDLSLFYFRQLLRGVAFCHRHGVCHRDIKPENLLLSEAGVIKITDFGLAVLLDGGTTVKGIAGTPAFLAPEVRRAVQRRYEAMPVDVWACGVVLYLFLTGKYPFMASDSKHLLEKIKRIDCPYPSCISSGAKDLLQSIFVADPRKRATIQSISKHEWMKRKPDPRVLAMQRNLVEGTDESGSTRANAFELLSVSAAFDVSGLLTQHTPQCTRFLTCAPLKTFMTRMTEVLCKMPLTFNVFERRRMLNLQVPFDNGMIVIIVQVHSTGLGLSIVDFKNWKGDAKEFFRIYREICERLGDIVLRTVD